MRGLAGRRVLVSGGSSGIGLATARRFLEEGCTVFIAGLDPAEVGQAVAALRSGPTPPNAVDVTSPGSGRGRCDIAGVGVEGWESACAGGVACDVSREDEVATMVGAAWDGLGGIDVLINNAGTAMRRPFLDITAAEWDRILAVNLRGMFLVARAVAERMVARGSGGVIVNMSSANAVAGEEDYAHYNASKGGVLLLTRTMAAELGRHGIRVNALCPGFISTPLNAAIAADLGGGAFEEEYARDRIPLGRTGRAEEVAAAYAFLASDDASFVHGTGLVIDGGQLAVM